MLAKAGTKPTLIVQLCRGIRLWLSALGQSDCCSPERPSRLIWGVGGSSSLSCSCHCDWLAVLFAVSSCKSATRTCDRQTNGIIFIQFVWPSLNTPTPRSSRIFLARRPRLCAGNRTMDRRRETSAATNKVETDKRWTGETMNVHIRLSVKYIISSEEWVGTPHQQQQNKKHTDHDHGSMQCSTGTG